MSRIGRIRPILPSPLREKLHNYLQFTSLFPLHCPTHFGDDIRLVRFTSLTRLSGGRYDQGSSDDRRTLPGAPGVGDFVRRRRRGRGRRFASDRRAELEQLHSRPVAPLLPRVLVRQLLQQFFHILVPVAALVLRPRQVRQVLRIVRREAAGLLVFGDRLVVLG